MKRVISADKLVRCPDLPLARSLRGRSPVFLSAFFVGDRAHHCQRHALKTTTLLLSPVPPLVIGANFFSSSSPSHSFTRQTIPVKIREWW